MFRFFRKHRTVVMAAMAACIAGVILFGVGGSSFVPSSRDTIIKINDVKVAQYEYDRIFNQMMRARKETTTTPELRQQLQGQALNELIRGEVFYQESKKYGIEVTDQELQMQIASIPAFQKDGQFDIATYARVVNQSLGISVQDFEKNHKKELAGRQLNQLIATTVHVPDDQLAAAMEARLKEESDSKKKKELMANPESLRQEMLDKEVNIVFADWLNQLNATLKVNIVSEAFKKQLNPPPPAPVPQ